jgi:hypothetical protein
MGTSPIVERFDEVEYAQASLFSGFIFFMVHKLSLEGPKEALGYSVVPAIALPAHALLAPKCFQFLPEIVASILTPSIRMN